jgi:CheY-like chemotaxis protein
MTGKTPRRWPGPPPFEPRRAERASLPPDERFVDGAASMSRGQPSPSAGPALARALAPSPVPRALVVDDDPEVRRALARFLRPELDVCLAGSVSDARALVENLDRLDMAFVDWELPDGTGEQILEWLTRWPDAIRVLISARFAADLVGPGSASSVGVERTSSRPSEWSSDLGEMSGARSKENPLKNRALANLVLAKPVATNVIEALKRAALALPGD